jgi:hypothetical protein
MLEARLQRRERRRLVRLENVLLDAGRKVSTGPPNNTSTRGLLFSAISRASASPEEKRMNFTLMPLAFSKASNIGRA